MKKFINYMYRHFKHYPSLYIIPVITIIGFILLLSFNYVGVGFLVMFTGILYAVIGILVVSLGNNRALDTEHYYVGLFEDEKLIVLKSKEPLRYNSLIDRYSSELHNIYDKELINIAEIPDPTTAQLNNLIDQDNVIVKEIIEIK